MKGCKTDLYYVFNILQDDGVLKQQKEVREIVLDMSF